MNNFLWCEGFFVKHVLEQKNRSQADALTFLIFKILINVLL